MVLMSMDVLSADTHYYAARNSSRGIVKAIIQSDGHPEQLHNFEGGYQAYNMERKGRMTSEGTTLNHRPQTTVTADQESVLDQI